MLAVMKDGVFAKAPEIAASRVAGSAWRDDDPRTRWAAWLADRWPDCSCSRCGRWSDNTRLYLVTLLNGLTLASLYFIVASGFTLVFGLMRNVNLAHGSLYLLGGYVGYVVAAGRQAGGSLALAAGFLPRRWGGLLMQWG